MDNRAFRKLSEGGAFSLPYLLHVYNKIRHVYLINDNRPYTYKGVEFEPSAFSYINTPLAESTLSVELVNNDIKKILDESTDLHVEILGVLIDDDNGGKKVYELQSFFHSYGNATWTGKQLDITFQMDERFHYTYPALIFNSLNARGTAN